MILAKLSTQSYVSMHIFQFHPDPLKIGVVHNYRSTLTSLSRKLCLLCLSGKECVVNWPVMWLLSEVDCLCNISPVNMSHQTHSLSPSVIWIQCGYFKTRYTPLNVNSSLLVPLQNLIWITYVSSWQGQKESCSSTLMNAYIMGKVASNTLKL